MYRINGIQRKKSLGNEICNNRKKMKAKRKRKLLHDLVFHLILNFYSSFFFILIPTDESLTCNVCDRAFHCHRQLASHQQKKRHFGWVSICWIVSKFVRLHFCLLLLKMTKGDFSFKYFIYFHFSLPITVVRHFHLNLICECVCALCILTLISRSFNLGNIFLQM